MGESIDNQIPEKLNNTGIKCTCILQVCNNLFLGFVHIVEHYCSIIKLMPDEFELTLGTLQECITDEQMCVILSSENSAIANKIILDCLIEQMDCKEDVFKLCHQLAKINNSKDMETLIEKLRIGGCM